MLHANEAATAQRLIDAAAHEFALHGYEAARVRDITGPQWARLEEIVRAILGPAATDEDVSLCALSAASQWVFFLFGRRMFELQFPLLATGPRRVDRLADHIATSAIAAMRELRRKREEAPGEPAAEAAKLPRGKPPKIPRAPKSRPAGRGPK